MGIKDLFSYLLEVNADTKLFEDTTQYLSIDELMFIDFNSFFYKCMYFVKVEKDIEQFPYNVAKSLMNLISRKKVYFIDKGDILPKNNERCKRKNKKLRDIDIKILDNKEIHQLKVLSILECSSDHLTHRYNDNHEDVTKSIQNVLLTQNSIAVYSVGFDAEYSMVICNYLFGKLFDNKNITLVSNDQDTVALAIINTPYSMFVYQGAYYRLSQEQDAITYSQLITYVTVICNKSDYYNGLSQITAKTFLTNNKRPYNFNISLQSKTEEIVEDNKELFFDIILNIKKRPTQEEYYDFDNNAFKEKFVKEVILVSRFLTLDTSFFSS